MSEVAVIQSAPIAERAPAELSLLQTVERMALNPNVDPDKIERLLQIHERMVSKAAETDFNRAMAECQGEMRPVAVDASNPQTHSKYASYAALDRALRPIYTKHGFSISFDEADSPRAEHVRILAYVAHRAGFTRTYHTDMPADGKGAKGGDVMTKTHAVGAAKSYGMRYLMRGIFNIAVGEEDDDGNGGGGRVEFISSKQAADLEALLTEVGAKPPFTKFLAWAKVSTVDEIPAAAYLECVRAIRASAKR